MILWDKDDDNDVSTRLRDTRVSLGVAPDSQRGGRPRPGVMADRPGVSVERLRGVTPAMAFCRAMASVAALLVAFTLLVMGLSVALDTEHDHMEPRSAERFGVGGGS